MIPVMVATGSIMRWYDPLPRRHRLPHRRHLRARLDGHRHLGGRRRPHRLRAVRPRRRCGAMVTGRVRAAVGRGPPPPLGGGRRLAAAAAGEPGHRPVSVNPPTAPYDDRRPTTRRKTWTSASGSDHSAEGARGPARRRHRRRRRARAHRQGARRRRHPVAHRPPGPPGRRARRQGRLRRDRLAPTPGAASASAADRRPPAPAGRGAERPATPSRATSRMATDLLDRRLLFVTGKGGVGKTTIAAALGAAGRRAGQAHAGLRGRRQGQPGRLLRDRRRPAFEPTRGRSPSLWAMSMDTEESLKEYLQPPAQAAAARPDRAAGPHLRLRGQRRAGGQGDPHRRQARAGRSASATTTSSSSTPPATRPHRRPARGARRPSTSWCRSGWCATRPAGCSTSSATRPSTGVGDRGHARGDAGQRDARAGRAGCADETDVDLAAVVVNRVLPELFGRGEEEVFERAARAGDAVAALAERGRRAGRAGARRRRAGGDAAPHPGRAPRPTCATALARRVAAALRARTCSPRTHGVRATRQVAEALGAELGY